MLFELFVADVLEWIFKGILAVLRFIINIVFKIIRKKNYD